MKKSVVITGATGFIGAHLANRLVNENFLVHLIVRNTSNTASLEALNSSFTLHYYDGTQGSLNSIFEKVKPVTVYHLASLFLPQHKSEDVEDLIESNILFGTQLLEVMSLHNIHQLVNTGTSWQHYQNNEFDPVNLYAATKEAFDKIVKFYTETTLLKVITLKLFDTYGPNDTRKKLFTLLKENAEFGTTLQMSPGEQLIDIVYIDDVVEAFVVAGHILEDAEAHYNKNYAISSGNPISLKRLVEVFGTVVGRKLDIEFGGREYRNREVMIPWNNGESLPGWRPLISLEEGIILTMNKDEEVV